QDEAIQETVDVEVAVPDAIDDPAPEPIAAPVVEAVQPVVPMPVAPQPVVVHTPAPESIAPPLAAQPIVAPPAEQRVAPPAPAVSQLVPPEIEAHPPVRVVTRIDQPHPVFRPTPPARMDLQGWIAYAFERGATTLFLRAGAPAAARINDRIVPFTDGLVSASV